MAGRLFEIAQKVPRHYCVGGSSIGGSAGMCGGHALLLRGVYPPRCVAGRGLSERSLFPRRIVLAVFSVFFAVSALCAQEINISLSVDKNSVSLDDYISLQVTVSGDTQNLPAPEIPPVDGFYIRSSGTSQSVSIVNGKVSATINYSYIMKPQKTGNFSFGPVSIKYKGKVYKSNVIKVNAFKFGSSPPAQAGAGAANAVSSKSAEAPYAFAVTSISKNTVFVGEELILSFKFFHRVRLFGDSNYKQPDIIGFVKEDLPPQLNYRTTVNGIQYNVAEIRTALFATSAGKHVIGPTELVAALERTSGRDRLREDFFRQFFSPGERKSFKTKPIEVLVKEHPVRKKPADFKGAVGDFTIDASADKSMAVVNEPVTITVTVKGWGNINSINEPHWPETNDFKMYPTVSSVKKEVKDHHLTGTKVFQKVFIPQRSGDLKLPAVRFSYLDPVKSVYKVLKKGPFALTVKPGEKGLASGVIDFSQPTIKMFGRDIVFIKSVSEFKNADEGLLSGNLFIRFLFVFAPFIYAGIFIYIRKAKHMTKHASLYRATLALRKSKKELSAVLKKFKKDNNTGEYLASMSNIFTNFLADKLGCSSAGLTVKELNENFSARNVDSALSRSTGELLEEVDFLRFAPSKVKDIKDLDSRILNIIDRLDKELRGSRI